MKQGTQRRTIWLCMALFFVQPIQLGIWLAGVAEVKAELVLNNYDLALGLLGMPIGLLPTLYFAGRIVDRFGPRTTLLYVFPPMLLTGVLPGMATSAFTLFLALFCVGVFVAFAEVGLNVFAARVEKALGTSIMNRAHGFWSLGVMAGSFIAVQMAGAGLKVAESLQVGGLALFPIVMLSAFVLPVISVRNSNTKPVASASKLPLGLVLIVLVVFGATIVEGAMIDWSAVYMRDLAGVVAGTEGLAVTVFAGFVTFGRFFGDMVNNRFGPVVLARMCIGSALTGLVVLTLNLGPNLSYLGFAFVGLGVSSLFPLGVSASAALSEEAEARNVSIMTFGALSGFLIGPPMIGFVAEQTALNVAFALLLPPIALSFVLAGQLSKAK